jgi:hypothetical protein
MAVSDQQLLSQVESALSYVLGGCVGEYEIEGRHLIYLKPMELMELRANLQMRISRAATGMFATAEFRGPRRG